MIFSTESSQSVVVGALVVFLVAGCFCGPPDDRARANGRQEDGKRQDDGKPLPMTGRTSRLQRPTQVLNTGFDEIVVESNLQVHNRVGSKNKSKITLPSNSTASSSSPPTANKSSRSLLV